MTVNAKVRTTTGKSAAKNLRKVGSIPAVMYNDKGEVTMLEINAVEFNKAWRTVTATTPVDLTVDGKTVKALIKDVEYNIRNDQVLLPARQMYITILIHIAQIPGIFPAGKGHGSPARNLKLSEKLKKGGHDVVSLFYVMVDPDNFPFVFWKNQNDDNWAYNHKIVFPHPFPS